jgi:hypothetical protein
MRRTDVSEDDLHAFVDGELGAGGVADLGILPRAGTIRSAASVSRCPSSAPSGPRS